MTPADVVMRLEEGVGAAERLGSARARAWSDVTPLAVAVIPFAIAIGATIADAEVHPVAGLAGAVLIIAGSAQLAALGLIDSGAGIVVAAGTALMINVRFVLYSARLSHWFAGEPRWLRMLLAIPLVDQTFLICERRFTDVDDRVWRRSYYIWTSVILVAAFVMGQLIGVLVGGSLPPSAGLSMAVPLAFAGMLAMGSKEKSTIVAAVAGGGIVLVTAGLPGGLGLPLAALGGIVIGSIFDGPARSQESL